MNKGNKKVNRKNVTNNTKSTAANTNTNTIGIISNNQKKISEQKPKLLEDKKRTPTNTTTTQVASKNLTKRAILKPSKKYNSENYLSDLDKTLNLNLEILKNFYQTNTTVNTLLGQDNKIMEEMEKMKKILEKKKNLINKVKEHKSKLLIESQIISEKKRKLEEMKDFYNEQIKENEEGVNNKEEFIKIVQKRLIEVEAYIRKLAQELKDKNREKYYKEFSMEEFLDNNDELYQKKDILTKKIEKIKNDLENTKEENKTLKNRNQRINGNQPFDSENSFDDEVEINVNNEKRNYRDKNSIINKEQVRKLVNKYKNKIQIMNSRINLLRNTYEKISEKFELLKIGSIIMKKREAIKNQNQLKRINPMEEKDKEKDEENINDNKSKFDLTNKLNSFWDFSIYLNNNKFEETKMLDLTKAAANNNFGNISKSNIWNISTIPTNNKDQYVDRNFK